MFTTFVPHLLIGLTSPILKFVQNHFALINSFLSYFYWWITGYGVSEKRLHIILLQKLFILFFFFSSNWEFLKYGRTLRLNTNRSMCWNLISFSLFISCKFDSITLLSFLDHLSWVYFVFDIWNLIEFLKFWNIIVLRLNLMRSLAMNLSIF